MRDLKAKVLVRSLEPFSIVVDHADNSPLGGARLTLSWKAHQ